LISTESQIEKANLAELDWALAHMDSSSASSSKVESSKELVEADSKLGKEDVGSLII
jgi:hypothetical protein